MLLGLPGSLESEPLAAATPNIPNISSILGTVIATTTTDLVSHRCRCCSTLGSLPSIVPRRKASVRLGSLLAQSQPRQTGCIPVVLPRFAARLAMSLQWAASPSRLAPTKSPGCPRFRSW